MRLRYSLGIILFTAIFFRLANQSPFKFYPDAYQSLLVARNIRNYESVTGFMGDTGMFYPDFFSWTRPMYPLLVNSLYWIFYEETFSAHVIAFILAVASIPLTYKYINKVYKDRTASLMASGILAMSFNHIVWGGFVLTETTGVFFVLLFLLALLNSFKNETKIADIDDLLTGFSLGLAVFTRYEYLILIFPAILLTIQSCPKPRIRIINISVSLIITSAMMLSWLYPVNSLFSVISQQLPELLKIAAAVILFFLAFFALSRSNHRKLRQKIARFTPPILTIMIWTAAFIVVAVMLLGNNIQLLSSRLSGLAVFFRQDFVLGIVTVWGLTMMLKSETYRRFAYFVLFSSVSLFLFYNRINPAMQRYATHLLPFLLLPAGLGMKKIADYSRRNRNMQIIVIAAVLIQVIISWRGIKYWDLGEWFKPSYEERAAKMTKNIIAGRDVILIASFPEPYYYFTNLSVHSINDNYPHIYIDDSLNDQKAVVIADMGMYDQFPNFSKFLTDNLKDSKTSEFRVGSSYRYANRREDEIYPVTLYETTVGDLKTKISGKTN